MVIWALVVAALAQASLPGLSFKDYRSIEIPEAYRGTWSLDQQFCGEPGPAVVTIESRRIDFYEEHGFLSLGDLNFTDDPPEFHGRFQFTGELRFWDASVRLRMEDGHLYISQTEDPHAEGSTIPWVRCKDD